MGGAVSAGCSNDELVDNLCNDGYINEPSVEKVFRCVDRMDYMIFEEGEDVLEAYEDHAWRKGNLHLSAPCIYTRALEALKLKRGVSFLNIGSGTGYLSTMAGLIIGPYGVNHGIELHQDSVEHALMKLEEFRLNSPWYDPVEFCEPVFVTGNGLLVSPGNMLYDRIYCGAGCPTEHAQLMRNMISIGGMLVMPLETELECITRTGESDWETSVVLPSVSFASLVVPTKESLKDLQSIEIPVEPHSLKGLCRLEILKQLGRANYSRVHELPLPQHLKEYVSYHRDWTVVPEPVKALCPIDRTKEKPKGNGEAGNGPILLETVDLNGPRIRFYNVNGLNFLLPNNVRVNRDSSSGEESMLDDNNDPDPDNT